MLDAQVEWVLAELSGARLSDVAERDARDVLQIADRIVVADAVARDDVKAAARRYVAMVGDSPLIELLTREIADAIYTLAAADEHELGSIIGRDHVDRLVGEVLRMRDLRDRALERLGESPVVGVVAAWFVNKIVTDFVVANTARAERLPGVGQLAKAGRRAAGAVRSQADRHLGDVLGDVAGRGAQLAFRRLSVAVRETMDEAPLHEAVMEFWDLHAGEPVSNLREYLSRQDLAGLVATIHEIWLTLRDTDYFGAAVDAGIDVFFDNYGAHTIGGLLDELGIEREALVADARQIVPPIVEAARATGELERLVRERLEPFWLAPRTLALLGA